MSKKNKKKQSRMSNAAKENLRLGASALVSNAACVELGQKKPWYGAVITAVLSIIIAAVPILTQALRPNGGDVLKTPSYGFETGLVHFQNDLKESGANVEFKVEKSSLTVSNWKEFLTTPKSGATETEPWYHHVNDITKKVDFAVFVSDLEGEEFAAYVKKVYSGINPSSGAKIGAATVNVGSEEATEESSSDKDNYCNTVIFGKNTFRIYKASTLGKWVDGSPATLLDYSAGELPINELAKTAPNGAEEFDAYIVNTRKAWSKYLDAAYSNYKVAGAWRYTGIMTGAFVFFIFFMGLMIFIMTRGKNNPYRIYTFWMTQKMSYWAAFTPAVLSMILGFALAGGQFAQYIMLLFIGLFGIRVMWLSMKTFRPQA
ncbi:MAG: hypothetical protein J6328_00625 [Bacilli bacterium]|nr:hypothetical protein [Bacilli bacterium]